jgi:hypothetical protein
VSARRKPRLASLALASFIGLAGGCDGETTDPDATVVKVKHRPCGWGQICFEMSEKKPQAQRRAAYRALACQHNSDCTTGLSCKSNYCVAQCNEDRDCEGGQICRTAAHGFGACVAGTGRPGILKKEAELVMDAAAKRARSCLTPESIEAGREVRMHVTAYGETGRVKEVVLPGSWEMTGEGACMRDKVATAQFSPFDRETQGFWYVLDPKGDADAEAHYVPEAVPALVAEAAGKGPESASAASAPKREAGKLSAEALQGALAGPKRKARECFAKVGAAVDGPVSVHLTVQGSSGLVAKTKVDTPHEDTPLGTCVAAKLAESVFPTFEAEEQSFVLKLRAP